MPDDLTVSGCRISVRRDIFGSCLIYYVYGAPVCEVSEIQYLLNPDEAIRKVRFAVYVEDRMPKRLNESRLWC